MSEKQDVQVASREAAREICEALAVNDDINAWHKGRILPMITDIIARHFPVYDEDEPDSVQVASREAAEKIRQRYGFSRVDANNREAGELIIKAAVDEIATIIASVLRSRELAVAAAEARVKELEAEIEDFRDYAAKFGVAD